MSRRDPLYGNPLKIMPAPDGNIAGTEPSILVVNSDQSERMAIAALLREVGFHVVTAADRRAALAAVAAQDFEAAVVAAQDGDGADLIRRARRHRPGLKALFVAEPGMLRLVDDERSGVVTRPLDGRQILRCVFELLLREQDHAARSRLHYAAECAIAAAEMACLHNRRTAAENAGAGGLADELGRRIGETRTIHRAHAALAGIDRPAGDIADH